MDGSEPGGLRTGGGAMAAVAVPLAVPVAAPVAVPLTVRSPGELAAARVWEVAF